MIEVKVPVLPESINEATVAVWHKKPGDFVELDDVIVEIETEKVVLGFLLRIQAYSLKLRQKREKQLVNNRY